MTSYLCNGFSKTTPQSVVMAIFWNRIRNVQYKPMSIATLPIPSWLNTTYVPFDPFPKLGPKVTNKDTKFMLCAVVKDEELYIDEWLEYHKFLGFDFAMLFDNADSVSTYMTELPKKYPEYVTIHHGPGLKQQDVNYMKCVNTFQNTSMWAAFIDVDEFIVLHKHKNIREYVQDVAPFGASIAINRAHFTSNGEQTYKPFPVLYRFQTRLKSIDHRVKSIAYMPHLNHTMTHMMQLYGDLPILNAAGLPYKEIARGATTSNNDGAARVALVNHYFTKSFQEFKKKRLRGLAGHSERYSLYQGTEGKEKIMREFHTKDADRTVQDTFAWHFYRTMKDTTQTGSAYGANFPAVGPVTKVTVGSAVEGNRRGVGRLGRALPL